MVLIVILAFALMAPMGITGLVLFVVGLVRHRAGMWGTGLGLVAMSMLLLVVDFGMVIGVVARTKAGQAKSTAATTDITRVGAALDAFEVDCGRYPTNDEGLDALVTAPRGMANWHGPYIKKKGVPTDPWGRAFIYRCPGEHNPSGYDLLSLGPDGREGGGDDIDNWSGR
jgi:general secretion pathway protein G